MEELDFIIESSKEMMENAIIYLEKELVNIRAGKANPIMLSSIMLDYYGSQTPLSQIANISTPDSRTLTIQPWEKSMLDEITKSVINANLGLNPQSNGEVIIISVPVLTEERRIELVKRAKAEGEHAKVSVRSQRKDANDMVRSLKDDGLSEDAIKDAEDNIQQEYDNIIKSIILRPKEFKYNINFLEQSFKFQAKEMNTALFQFQSFDLNILKEMNEVKKNVETKQLTGSESAIICEYNLLENIEIAKFPDLSINFENAQIIDTESISSKINVYFDGTVEYFFKNYTYQFDKSNFDLSRFPFDSHNIQTVIKLNMDDLSLIHI